MTDAKPFTVVCVADDSRSGVTVRTPEPKLHDRHITVA